MPDLPQASSLFRPRGLEIASGQVLRMMGYRPATPPAPQVARIAEAMAALAAAAIAPAVAYRRVAVASCTPEGLELGDGTRFRGPTFAAILPACREVAAFVLSLGPRFDASQKNLAATGKSLEAYALEIAGWLAIESATNAFREYLKGVAGGEGLVLTRRMAPGYATRLNGTKVEWPLEDQPALFALFDPETLPARLLEGSCAMTPKMSRSGLYGLKPNTGIPPGDPQDE